MSQGDGAQGQTRAPRRRCHAASPDRHHRAAQLPRVTLCPALTSTPLGLTSAGAEENMWALTSLFAVTRWVETQAEAAVHCQAKEAVGRSVHIVSSCLGCFVATFLCPS